MTPAMSPALPFFGVVSEVVNLRVAEEPEQVLPQDGATISGIVDVAAQLAVIQNAQCRSGQQWENHEHDGGCGKHSPAENRQTEHGHARCAQGQDGRNHVDSGGNGTDTGSAHADNPHIRADARGVDTISQRHVHGPAEVSRTTWGNEAQQHDDAAQQGNPEAEGIQTREGHVRRTNLQRQNVVTKAPHNWGCKQQQHHGAVHGEQLVELLIGQELETRGEQLRADQQCHKATEEEEAEGHNQVHDAQLLVVGGG